MNPVDVLAVLRAADALLVLLSNAGISMQRYNELRAQNSDGHLSDAQLLALVGESREAVDNLG